MCVCVCVCAGEFGSVMEGSLTQEDSVLKVAVKTMKSESIHGKNAFCTFLFSLFSRQNI